MRTVLALFLLLYVCVCGVRDAQAEDVDPILTAPRVSMQMLHDYILATLKMRFADAKFKDLSADNIEIDWPDGASLNLGLSNLLATVNSEPTARQDNLDEFLDSMTSGHDRSNEPRSLTIEDIGKSAVAMVRNEAYVDELVANVEEANKSDNSTALFWHPTRFVSHKLCGDLVILLMLDSPTALSPLDGNEPAALIFGDDQLFRIALANTQRRSNNARFQSLGGGLTRILLDDESFNSSIMGVDSFWRGLQLRRGGGAIAVAAPTRANIVFASADQPDQIAALRRVAQISPAPYPLSQHLYKYDNGSWSQLADQ